MIPINSKKGNPRPAWPNIAQVSVLDSIVADPHIQIRVAQYGRWISFFNCTGTFRRCAPGVHHDVCTDPDLADDSTLHCR